MVWNKIYRWARANFSSSVSRLTNVKRIASFSRPKIPPGIFLKNCFSTDAIVFTLKLWMLTSRPCCRKWINLFMLPWNKNINVKSYAVLIKKSFGKNSIINKHNILAEQNGPTCSRCTETKIWKVKARLFW